MFFHWHPFEYYKAKLNRAIVGELIVDHHSVWSRKFEQISSMIIDAKTVVITLIVVAIAFYAGLQVVRRFALTIAQENLDANMADDAAEEAKRLKRERDADAAAASALAKVQPLLPSAKVSAPTLSSGNKLESNTALVQMPAHEPIASAINTV